MQYSYQYISKILALFLVIILSGCANLAGGPPAATSTPPPATEAAITATAEITPTAAPVADPNILYHDDFTNPATGWAEEKFDNYFIGYHEPEYYHVAIASSNYKTTVFVPDKPDYTDATIEVNTFTFAAKTAETGDYRYGVVFRRSGDQYYAFTVSQRTKKWAVLKSTPNELQVLKEGTDPGINDLDVVDTLRVDAQGSTFFFRINDQFIAQVDDSDYATGEVGFYAQTLDAESLHVHFDSLTIRKLEAQQITNSSGSQGATLYADDFTNPATGWPEKKFDNYFIGYHEPEYYHVAITGANYKTTVFVPNKPSYGDVTVEVTAFTFASKTAETGDFRYGIALRRSGDQYYAFTLSQRTKKWAVLKSTPNELLILKEGTDPGIHDFDTGDILRVDAKGSSFFFHINDEFITQVDDSDYATGEVGFYVQTLDAESLHVHFDALAIREFKPSLTCTIEALKMNVRSGPGNSYVPVNYLSRGDIVEPIGISKDGQWLNIKSEGDGPTGWIAKVTNFVNCNASLDILPIANP